MDGENPAVTPSAGDNRATGDERVDEAVAGLGQLPELPVEDHPAVLEAVHARLGEVLARLDEHSLDEHSLDGHGLDGDRR